MQENNLSIRNFFFLWGFNFKVFKNKKKMLNAHFEERLHKVNMFKFRNCT